MSDPREPEDASRTRSPDPSAVEHLDAATCWALLQATELGRLAVVRADGAPDLFPVNYVAHEGALYVRTARDSKLLHVAHNPVAAFEIDRERTTTAGASS